MTRKQRRLTMIGGSLAVLAVAAALVLNAMRDSIVFFSTPAMVAEKHVPAGKRFRLGGLVQPGSLVCGDKLAVTFGVADGSAAWPVSYKGILPDLFREGQGVVAEGALDSSGVFEADTVLAKHDERNALKVWTILLAILTFSLSLLGTFLVRSGVLTSVHAFATDPTRGVFILLILCIFIGGSLTLYAWRASALKQGGLFAPISREGALVLNNLFLTTACATVFVGTLYPLALEVLTGDKISVGAPFFNLTFAPLFLPLMIAVPFGPLLAWKRGDLLGAAQRLIAAGIAALVAIAVLWAWTRGGSTFAPLAIGLAVFVISGALCDLAERTGLFRMPFATAMRRGRGLPRSTWGTMFAHAGVGVALIGIVCETTWNSEYIGSMKPDDVAKIAGYELKLDGVTQRQGPNFREMLAQFTVTLDGKPLSAMTPSKRNFPARGSSTTEAALLTRGASQLYISLGDTTADGAIAVRIYHKPLVLLIWWGPVLMAFGGMLSLSDRRLRVGAPKPAKALRGLQAAE
jgi:cytochrome c-type biogenesis protein CcmF